MTNELLINKIQCEFMIDDLIDQITYNNEKFTHIIGIANGGLNISIPISKKLNLPHKSVTIRFYGDDKTPHEKVPKETNFTQLQEIDENSNILFLDDLLDNGSTLNYLKQYINNRFKYKIAVLYHNKNNQYNITPDYYCYEKPDKWITFFWEI